MGNWKLIDTSGNQKDFETDFGFRVTQAPGTGFPPVDVVYIDYGLLDGGVFQRQRSDVKHFSLIGAIHGSDIDDLLSKRGDLIDALKPDRTTPQEPVIIQYDNGTTIIQASAYYDGGLELGNVSHGIEPRVAIKFVQFDPFWERGNASGVVTTTIVDGPTIAELANANYCVRRDDTGTWRTFGTGADDVVKAFAERSGSVFLGGQFTEINGASASMVVSYDASASTFDTMASGVGGTQALAIAVAPNDDVYVAGDLDTVNGSAASYIGRYDGSTWYHLGTADMDNTIYALAITGTTLWIGGDFTAVNGSTACRIVAWDTESLAYTAPSGGVDGIIYDMTTALGGKVYFGGLFTTVNGSAACYVGSFDGTDWDTLDGGVTGSPILAVERRSDGYVYAAGEATIDGTANEKVGQWSGYNWSSIISSCVNDKVNALSYYPDDGTLLAAGTFTEIDSASTRMGIWNSSRWYPGDIIPACTAVDKTVEIYTLESFDNDSAKLCMGYEESGTASVANVITVNNPGTSATYPNIIFKGPGILSQLINFTTGHKIYFNISMATGESASLNLHQGEKTFTSSAQGNIISTIVPGSDVATWRLNPGNNYVSVLMNNSSACIEFEITSRSWSV